MNALVSNHRSFYFLLIFLSSLALFSSVKSQTLPDIPDSTYVKDEIIIWFQDGLLNPYYLGCEQDTLPPSARINKVTSLPLDTTFIRSQEIVDFLSNIGVASIEMMIPSINPCHDIKSVSRTGDTLWMPHFWNALVIKFNQEQDIPSIAYTMAFLFYDKLVLVQPNFIYVPLSDNNTIRSKPPKINFQPNDSLWYNQTNLYSDNAGRVHVDSAWNYTTGDSTLIIGILDSGLDYRHPDLGGSVGPTSRVRGGYNYLKKTSNFFSDGLDVNKRPWVFHGTAVASVVGAITNNSIGISGVVGGNRTGTSGCGLVGLLVRNSASIAHAVWESSVNPLDTNTVLPPPPLYPRNLWNCTIIQSSIWTKDGIDANGNVFTADEIVRSIVAFSYANGRIFTQAMGNKLGKHVVEDVDTVVMGYPADVDKEWVITVSQNDVDENIRTAYDYGLNLDLLAITNMSVDLDSIQGQGMRYSYKNFGATSGATPVVSGIEGLLLSYFNLLTKPTLVRGDSLPDKLVPEDVEWILKHTAQRPPGINHFVLENGWGVINADSALAMLRYPYVLYHFTEPYSGEGNPSQWRDTLLIKFPGYTNDSTYLPSAKSDSVYEVERHHLTQHVYYPKVFSHVERAWGFGSKETGYNWPFKIKKLPYRMPLYKVGYCSLIDDNAFTNDYCELQTNVYKAWTLNLRTGQRGLPIWIPCAPNKVKFAYSVLANVSRITFIEKEEEIGFALSDPYPNPAIDRASINYSLDKGGTINVDLFDVLGRKIRTLHNTRYHDIGKYTLEIKTSQLNSGMYFLKFTTPSGRHITKKLLVRK